jgi:hypothetical protein
MLVWQRGQVPGYTEAMETKVCAPCAHEARRLGLSVGALDREEGENRRTASGDTPSSV